VGETSYFGRKDLLAAQVAAIAVVIGEETVRDSTALLLQQQQLALFA